MSVNVINDSSFEQEVINSEKPVLVDFYADWCAPCRMLSPIIDELSGEIDNVKFVKMNIDANRQTPSQFGIMSIPTLIFFKGGKAVDTFIGVQPKEALRQRIIQHTS